MKKTKVILCIVIGLIGMTSYAQIRVNDSIYLSGNQVGYIKSIKNIRASEDPFSDLYGVMNTYVDVDITTPLNVKESISLNNQLLAKCPNGNFNFNYNYKLWKPSDYIKASANLKDRAIKTRITTALIGAGVGIIGGVIASQPPNDRAPIPYRDLGIAVSGIGVGIGVVGNIVSIKIDLDANKALRKSSEKFKENGF